MSEQLLTSKFKKKTITERMKWKTTEFKPKEMDITESEGGDSRG